MLTNLWSDIRYAARGLRHNPGFTATAILSIALGIGINTGIFSVLNGIALRELPVPDADQLVSVHQNFGGGKQRSVHGTRSMFSTVEYRAYQHTETLTGILGYSVGTQVMLGSDNPELVSGVMVTCNYFEVLGLKPAIGPGFDPHCDERDAVPSVVLGHDLWTTSFGGDPNLIGKEAILNRRPFRVVGIAPPDFHGVEIIKSDFFVSISAQGLTPGRDFYNSPNLSWLSLIGRRKPGMGTDRVRAELRLIADKIDRQDPGRRTTVSVERASSFSMPEQRGPILLVGGIVMAAFGLVLLIACANVANLLLARASNRRKEMAVRLSMGSTRGRILQQLLTESLIISVLGGLLGSILAVSSFHGLVIMVLGYLPSGLGGVSIDTTADFSVLIFGIGLTLLTGLFFGLVPALDTSKLDLYTTLKEDSAGAGRVSQGWLRNGLVGVQVAVCLVLMIAAALLLRGLYAAQTVDPGFAYKHVAVAEIELSSGGYESERATAFQQQLLQRAAALPGVEAVAQVQKTPLSQRTREDQVHLPGQQQAYRIGYNYVSPAYFDAIGIPIVLGRTFNAVELNDNSRSIIVTEATARRYWPGQNPLGKTLSMYIGPTEQIALEVVGVAKDAHISNLSEIDNSYMYQPANPSVQPQLQLLVRSRTDLAQIANGISGIVQELGPGLVVQVRPLEDNLGTWRNLSRLAALLASSLGVLALLLASIGVYGVVSYTVNRRLRELGIRMVLGASAADIRSLILKQAMRPVVIGSVTGLLAAAGSARILQSVLFGVSAFDPMAFLGAPLVLIAIAAIATLLPARRAMKVDPMTTLRYE